MLATLKQFVGTMPSSIHILSVLVPLESVFYCEYSVRDVAMTRLV